MSSTLKYLLSIPIWIAALFGSVQIYRLDLNLGHSICGAWGCGPPVEALIGYHSFWLVLIVPIATLTGLVLPVRFQRYLGWALLVGGLLAAATYVVRDGLWYHEKSGSWEHVTQRAWFALVTGVDHPMFQVAIAGLCVLVWPRGKPAPASASPTAGSPFEPAVDTLSGGMAVSE